MGKIIYVNGHIIVTSKFFLPKEIGCGYRTPPEGAEIVDASTDFEGVKCLLINDEHPQSLFNEYYAKEDFSAVSIASSYLSASIVDIINIYKERVGEAFEVIKGVADWDECLQGVVYKMAYVNLLTALDAFICYVLLMRCSRDEVLFNNLMNGLAQKSKIGKWKRLKAVGKDGEWEQDAIKYVLNTSFLDTDKIDKAFKMAGFAKLDYDRQELESFFTLRHVIVHRNGRRRDDGDVVVTYDLLKDMMSACYNVVGTVFDSVCLALSEELKNKPKEKDIYDVFPSGFVRTPFKLSDLMRLLRSRECQKEFEPIQLPLLD